MNTCSKRFGGVLLLSIIALVAVASSSAEAANTVVKFEISAQWFTAASGEPDIPKDNYVIDEFYIRLLDDGAPGTVQNFLNYVGDQDYVGSFFHRLALGFVLQGGGFGYDPAIGAYPVPPDPAIVNEFAPERSNVRGTIAMAKLGSGPDTATNQFFFNLGDNSANLDNQNGGFSVFAYVIGDGMDVVEQLSGFYPDLLDAYAYEVGGSPFDSVPLVYNDGAFFFEMISAVTVVGVDGDVDFDGDVDTDDYSAFMASFGQAGVGLAADFDGDYDVDLADFAVLRENFTGPSTSPLPEPGAAAPEPTSICLLGLCGMAIIRKRRRKA